MRIAICNRDKQHLYELKLMIYRYAEMMKIEIMADCYYCAEYMLASGNKYNMIFLDYDLIAFGELKTVESVRLSYNLCSIIIVSSNTSFMGDIFKLHPSDYLTYPIMELNVFRVLNNYFCKKGNVYPLLIKSEEDTVCLNTTEIVYLEADNKYCVVHLEEKSFNCHRTMRCVYEQLPKLLFLKINRSFVINSYYINSFNNAEVNLKTGKKLYISRNYLKDFKQNYIKYINAMQP